MNQEQKYLVTQAICNRFEQAPYGGKGAFILDVTTLISAVKLVNQPELVTSSADVAVDVNKGFVDGFDVGTNAVGSVGSADGGVVGLSTGSAEIGLSLDEFVQAIKGIHPVTFVISHN